MKRLFTLLMAVLISACVFAQSPEKMGYQAVIRNSGDALVTNAQIGMRISILRGSTSGTAVYVETQSPTTNANGLISIEIGGGTVESGDFNAIDWTDGPFFLRTETDPNGGSDYTIIGTSQLLSVPYALHAQSAQTLTGDIEENDPLFTVWDKSTGISITENQISDFQISVANNASVLLNTAKETNATHTGDVTGAGVLTLATVNSDIGTFNNITINAKGLATAGSNVSYLTSEADPIVKAVNGIVKSNGSNISAAIEGTDYLAPTGSAAELTDFPILNQNTSGSAASFTGSLVGEVTGTQEATIVGNYAVLSKVLTGYTSGAGTITASDNILQAIQKLNGNDATNANLTGMVTSVGNETTVVTNADLIGDVTSIGNTTTITNKVTMTGTAPISITGNPSVIATNPVAISIAEATTSSAGIMSAADKSKLDGIATTPYYLGQEKDGGIIYYIYKGSDGIEHGLIVSKTESIGKWSDSFILTGADKTSDGLFNTNLMANDAGTAKSWVESLGSGWYLPSIDELSLLWHNRFHINNSTASGLTKLSGMPYWSSTEMDISAAYYVYFRHGYMNYEAKWVDAYSVRAVRAF